MSDAPRDDRLLAHVRRIQAQKKLIARIRELGGDAGQAEDLLQTMTDALDEMRRVRPLRVD